MEDVPGPSFLVQFGGLSVEKAEQNGADDILAFNDEFAFLSNFHYATVSLDGVTYPTVEHAFQAAKTDDAEERRAIRDCGSPGRAKRMGKKVKLRKDWE